jgi:holo-[acyl-carrier protein] synthase
MIIGIGTDVLYINRIQEKFNKFGLVFAERILTREELVIFFAKSSDIKFLAKRFAAKEAIAKAFGVGIGDKLSFQDIKILNDELGAPFVKITSDIGINKNVHISISDESDIVVAFSVVSV